ncbi:hypothetical protein DERF_006860 [Dermatophagoides farinae]|uniref:Uncharacterized protein n=1 Tax=Dermatophagoides farinae TaxID=6954 RepID=A0A922I070_DERFA|nr:hypothetical protein DERF_006860 [Dermatophagoides farinae]
MNRKIMKISIKLCFDFYLKTANNFKQLLTLEIIIIIIIDIENSKSSLAASSKMDDYPHNDVDVQQDFFPESPCMEDHHQYLIEIQSLF